MPEILSGLDVLKKRMEDAQKAREQMQQTSMELRIKGDEIARLRILVEPEEIKTGYFHRVQRPTPKGKTFTEDIFCTAPNQECKYDSDPKPEVRALKSRMFVWVYVYYILHKNKDEKNTWVETDRAGFKFYREEVNSLKYIRTGEGWGGYIVNKFLAYYGKSGTLCDRDYEWIRQGDSMNNTVYDLLPEDPSKVSAAVKKVQSNLPSLEAIMKGEKVEPPNGAETKVEEKKEELPLLERLKREKGIK